MDQWRHRIPEARQPQTPGHFWSAIEESPDYLDRLAKLVPPPEALSKAGYVLHALTAKELVRKQRCGDCGGRMSNTKQKDHNRATSSDLQKQDENEEPAEKGPPPPKIICCFHPDVVRNLHFQCCGQHVSQPGCQNSTTHSIYRYGLGELEQEWKFYTFPRQQASPSHRSIVALDCEMGISRIGETELIKLSAIDYLTGETLIDSLVVPRVPMKHYNSRYSGVRAIDIRQEKSKRFYIHGRDGARAKLNEFVGPNTTIVMHGGQNDLSALRLVHTKVVDTFLLTYPGQKELGGKSLKNLTSKLLRRAIQQGHRGHSSLEDAFACRELLHWYLSQDPETLEEAVDAQESALREEVG